MSIHDVYRGNRRERFKGSLKEALKQEKPLMIVGVINAYTARLAKRCGFKAIYLSGAGVSNQSYGLPDLGMITLDNVLEDAKRILEVVSLPMLVDIDTGFGGPLMIERAVRRLELAKVQGIQIEDQVAEKRCGHREGKKLVSIEMMCERIKACVNGRSNPSFMIVARTDSLLTEGLDGLVKRVIAYQEAGCDMLFAEAIENIRDYETIKRSIDIPLLANMTEFGKTPITHIDELKKMGVDAALYPLTISRVMCKSALDSLMQLRKEGTQENMLDKMQTRKELYDVLDYESYEKKSHYTETSEDILWQGEKLKPAD